VIWLFMFLVAVLAMAPLAFGLRRQGSVRGRRSAAMALHRAQLAELDRDLAEGRIGRTEHGAAALEVQRRLLTAASLEEAAPVRGSPAPIWIVLLAVPLGALALYLVNGMPGMPSLPIAERRAIDAAQQKRAETLISQLRARLALMDPKSPQAREGYILLGNAEAEQANWKEAASAYNAALLAGFDPTTAAKAAETMTRAAGKVTPEAAALFRRALAGAPADASWRALVEQRLKELPPQ
jgi:cytochrome c-type biogenesis protein CcmH